jgi:anaerobic selenocysteine-containing dehydrogenase
MLPTLIIGVIFFGIVILAGVKSYKSMKNNSCPGCSGGCSVQERKSCGH